MIVVEQQPLCKTGDRKWVEAPSSCERCSVDSIQEVDMDATIGAIPSPMSNGTVHTGVLLQTGRCDTQHVLAHVCSESVANFWLCRARDSCSSRYCIGATRFTMRSPARGKWVNHAAALAHWRLNDLGISFPYRLG